MVNMAMSEIMDIQSKEILKSKLTIHERDQLFLEYAKEKVYVFDIEKGIIYNRKGHVLGTRGDKCHMHFFIHENKTHGISRSRAIWLYVHGFVPEGVSPSHKSEDRFDDSINNLELKTLSARSKKAFITKRWIINTREKCAKLTLELVNYARKEVLNPEVSYDDILNVIEEKIGQKISKPSLIFAVQGKTWKDATEPPVLHKPKKIILKKPRAARKKKPRVIKETPENPNKIMYLESMNVALSLLKNNPNISDAGISSFLRMRNFEPLSSNKIALVRRNLKLTKDK